MKTKIVDTQFTLKRGGSSRQQRHLPALATDYVLPEERDTADFLILLQKYARHLQFYNQQNQPQGDWAGLLGKDLSYLLALLSKEETTRILGFFNQHFIGEVTDKTGFKNIFDFLFSLLYRLDQHFLALPPGHPLHAEISNLILSRLSADLKDLVAYYKAGIAQNLVDEASRDYAFEFPVEIWASQDVADLGLSSPWYRSSGLAWDDFYSSILPDDNLFGSPLPPSNAGKIEEAREVLASLFERIFRIWGRIVGSAGQYFQESIDSYQDHQPQVSLLLSFLKLTDFANEHLNSFTQKHLDFYYRDVLALQKKPAVPDKLHLTFELQKNVDEYLLEKGSLLKAGKDDLGKDVRYEIEADTALNKAKVAELRSLFIEKENSNAPDEEQRQVKRLYHAPVANSTNGLEPVEENERWPQFGNNQMQLAEVGFAIASAMLFLEEGTREIVIAIEAAEIVDQSGFSHENFSAELTGEKGWFALPLHNPGDLDPPADNRLYFYGKLPADAEATFPYNAETHGGEYSTHLPLLRILLKNDPDLEYPYQPLKDIRIQKITLDVRVSGAQNLEVQTSLGTVDASKPFFPFGPRPVAGDYLEVGHREAALKNLSSVELELEWKHLPEKGLAHEDLRPFESYDDFLQGYDFSRNTLKVQTHYPVSPSTPPEENELFHPFDFVGPTTAGEFTGLLPYLGYQPLKDYLQPLLDFFNNSSGTPGFSFFQKEFGNLSRLKSVQREASEAEFDEISLIKLKLGPQDFGHKDYPNLMADAAIDPNITTVPEQAFTPEVASVSLNYSASQTVNFSNWPAGEKEQTTAFEERTAQFYHLHPFGTAEAHPYLDRSGNKISLITQFSGEAEFYIGIKDLKPPQNLSLLFQLAEGSENPLTDNPKVHWSFLSQNQWKAFEDINISDATDNLLKSGIISFSFPKEAHSESSLLGTGYHWLRAHVDHNHDAVSQAVAVLAQAATAVFVDQGNDPQFLATPLQAGTLSGLVVKDAAIKKVDQPYNSFGGRSVEADDSFYTRASERLRHKERAVSMWDYEHLILEHFPGIYKVKCLPHTQITEDIYNEKRPGHVAIIPIPNLKGDLAANPLEPYTSKALRNEMENFLKLHTSAWVQLSVNNPQFEQVKVKCTVELHEGLDETLYKKRLKEDLTRFLSPWAFDEQALIDFGGKIHESEILDYIEEREYVNYLRELKLFQSIEGTTTEVKEAVSSTGRSILVSVPQEEHEISITEVCAVK